MPSREGTGTGCAWDIQNLLQGLLLQLTPGLTHLQGFKPSLASAAPMTLLDVVAPLFNLVIAHGHHPTGQGQCPLALPRAQESSR